MGGVFVKKSSFNVLVLVLIGVFLLAGFNTPVFGSGHQHGGEITVALPADIKTLDARMITDVYSELVSTQIGDPLVELNERLEPSPALAESWETPDPMTYIFNLRQGVKFHDGTEFTAEDVKYTFETILDEDFGSPNRTYFLPVDDIEIIDTYTIQVTLSEPMAPFITQVMPMMQIVPKHIAEELGEDYAFNPVGTGPFEFVQWVPGDRVELRAFEDHWRGRPQMDELVIRVIEEASVQMMELEVGGIDFAYTVPPDDVEWIREDPNLILGEYMALAYVFIVPNLDHEILSNKLVRQAMAYAIDREEIAETIYAGLAVPASGPIPPSLAWAYNEEVEPYPYDPDKARELLAEAGYPDGFDIKLHRAPGEVGVLTMTAVQEQFADVGINMEIEVIEFGMLLDRLFSFEYDMINIGWTGIVDPDYATYSLFTTDGGYNFNNYSNSEIDFLLDYGRFTVNIDTRKEIYDRVQRILADELPHIFIVNEITTFAYNADLEGFIHAPRRYGGPLNDLWRVYWK